MASSITPRKPVSADVSDDRTVRSDGSERTQPRELDDDHRREGAGPDRVNNQPDDTVDEHTEKERE